MTSSSRWFTKKFKMAELYSGDWPDEYSVHQWSGRQEFNPRSSHTKDSKMVLHASLPNSHHYEVGTKGKEDQSRERGSALPCTYKKGSLRVTFDYISQLYLHLIYWW